MALQKSIQNTSNGAIASYWRINRYFSSYQYDLQGNLENITKIYLDGWVDANARNNGLQPIQQNKIVIVDDTIAKEAVDFRDDLYDLVKTVPEFDGATDV